MRRLKILLSQPVEKKKDKKRKRATEKHKYIPSHLLVKALLAKYLSCTPSTINDILDVLESKKLILKSREGNDRRKVLLSLSPRGLKTVRVVEDVGKEIEEIASDFKEEEKEVLGILLLKMSNKLVDKGCMITTNICIMCFSNWINMRAQLNRITVNI